MAARRQYVPVRTTASLLEVEDGTMCRAESPRPGPLHGEGVAQLRCLESGPAGDAARDGSAGGAILVGTGASAVARIPIPGAGGLHVELKAQAVTAQHGSTSALFVEGTAGEGQLRLDYSLNQRTSAVDYRWSQAGTAKQVGTKTQANATEAQFQSARVWQYRGKVLRVAGLAQGTGSIVIAKRRWKQVAPPAAGWAGSEYGGDAAAAVFASAEPMTDLVPATAVGALVGCANGGVIEYSDASWATGLACDWEEDVWFEKVLEGGQENEGRHWSAA